jgi:hypothetical protein
LVAAGFAPVWREIDLAAPELAQVGEALNYMLAQQEPFPAAVVDRRWKLLKANNGAVRLVEFLVGPVSPGAEINLADALVAPDILRPYLINWAEVVRYFIRSVEVDAAADGTAETAALLERLLGYQGVRSVVAAPFDETAPAPVLPMHFRKGEVSLQLFTTIATLGTPRDITLQELRIECFFPMDQPTADVLRAWAGKAAAPASRAAGSWRLSRLTLAGGCYASDRAGVSCAQVSRYRFIAANSATRSTGAVEPENCRYNDATLTTMRSGSSQPEKRSKLIFRAASS